MPHRREPYLHVISLGGFCSVAMELERYGLRDSSYPFDWLISPIQSALTLMESRFANPLPTNGLQPHAQHVEIVHDLEGGVEYYHDFAPEGPLEDQVQAVRTKYARRIQRLQAASCERTLFVRYILSPDGHRYLDENMTVVLQLLRRDHPRNDLLLVGASTLPATCGGMPVYLVADDEDDVVARKFARKNRALRIKLLTLRYPLSLRIRNYAWYQRQGLAHQERARKRAAFLFRARCAVYETGVRVLGEKPMRGLSALIHLRESRMREE